jgi:hypothetical protein
VALDLSVVGNTGIVFVLKDFCLLAAWSCYKNIQIRNSEDKKQIAKRLGKRRQNLFVHELQFEENENKTALINSNG